MSEIDPTSRRDFMAKIESLSNKVSSRSAASADYQNAHSIAPATRSVISSCSEKMSIKSRS